MLNLAHSLPKALWVNSLLVLCLLGLFHRPVFADTPTNIEYWQTLYPNGIQFDVTRNGDKVGDYTTTFAQKDSQLTVSSKLQIKLKWMGILPYHYQYQSSEVWDDDGLLSINIAIKENTDTRTIVATRTDATTFSVDDNQKGKSTLDGFSFTTNHYNANVIHTKQIFNTLTGTINNIEITQDTSEIVDMDDNLINAGRYNYTGDLKDTSVWYDKKGRWMKLSFINKDGSIIEFVNRGNHDDN